MYADDILLPQGTVIVTDKNIRFTLEGGVATGGVAVVYRARREDSRRLFVVKECCPSSMNFRYVRRDGVVHGVDETSEDFLDILKQNMARETEFGQWFSRKSGRTIGAWEDLRATEIIIDEVSHNADGSEFVVMEQAKGDGQKGWFLNELLAECAKAPAEGAPLRNGGLPSPLVATCIIEQLLMALRDLHNAGYIHGDVHGGNFFLSGYNLADGDIGTGMTLDFGGVRQLLPDGSTDVIADKYIFAATGYMSPEIYHRGAEPLRLTPATDIFSVGCLMLYLFKGTRAKSNRLAKSPLLKPPISIEKAISGGYRREAAALFSEILSKALKFRAEDRYKDADAMLKDIRLLKKLVAPPKFALPMSLSRSPYFVEGSRNRELERLRAEFDAGKNPLYIWGVGGMGKTELAQEFGRKMISDGVDSFLVTYRGSMRDTILNLDFSGYRPDLEHTVRDYGERLNILREEYHDKLLIIDNFDSEDETFDQLRQEAAFNDLVKTNVRLLITTRSRPDEATPELEPLTEEDAGRLFRSIAHVKPSEEEVLRRLLRRLECHPYSVELAALELNDSWGQLTVKDLLSMFARTHIGDEPEDVIKYHGEHAAKIFENVRTLFRLFNRDEYRDILCHATLLSDDGFDAATFLNCEDRLKKNQLRRLEARSWVRRRKTDNRIFVHPLIRSVLRAELNPSNVDCEKFLSAVFDRLERQYPSDEALHRQAGAMFDRAVFYLGDPDGEHRLRASRCYFVGRKNALAYVLGNQALKIILSSDDDVRRARAYANAGLLHAAMFDEETGVGYLFEAIKILRAVAPAGSELGDACLNLGVVLDRLNGFDVAIEFVEEAMKIYSSAPPKNFGAVVNAHYVLGHASTRLKRLDSGMRHLRKAEALIEECSSDSNRDWSRVRCAIGENFALRGEVERGVEHVKEVIRVLEREPEQNSREINAARSLILQIYHRTGRWEEMQRYNEQLQQYHKQTRRSDG